MSQLVVKNYHLYQYLLNGYEKIEGWCDQNVVHTVDIIDSASFNKQGGCLEIGVHHGKLFILMNSIIDPKFRSYAIDVFENQSLNIDKSGSGSLSQFIKNLNLYDVHTGNNTEIINGDSTDPALELEKMINPGSMRLISIDGGHTAQHTINDLHLAVKFLNNQGVVILDDILNPHWLGVIQGVVAWLETQPTLVPFAIGHNKLYMCKISYVEKWLEVFQASPLFIRHTNFFGYRLAFL